MRPWLRLLFCLALAKSELASVPDDCRQLSPLKKGLRLQCNLGAINSAEERTNFGVVPGKLTQILVVHCMDANLVSKIKPKMFGTLNQLRLLELVDCRAKEIPEKAFWGLKNLKSLRISSKKSLETMDSRSLIDIPSLERLDLSDNALMKISSNVLCPLLRLRALNVSNNELRQISDLLGQTRQSSSNNQFECLSNLRSLDLSYNKLTFVESGLLADLRKLERLRLDHNNINEIESRFWIDSDRLQMLDLSHNRLRTLPTDFFEKTKSLEWLDLSHNLLTFLDKSLFGESLKRVRVLDLSFNLMKSVNFLDHFSAENALISLDLSHNILTKIEENNLKTLSKLQNLNVSHNELSHFPSFQQNMQMLRTLDFSSNRFRHELDLSRILSALKSISHLLLSDNSISHISCSSASKSLQVLELSRNRLVHLELESFSHFLPNLQVLSLVDNRLLVHDLSDLRLSALWKLEIDGNSIERIETNTFAYLPALQHLGMGDCGISVLAKAAFANNVYLQTVRLDRNKLERMDGVFHSLSELKSLNVSHNQLTIFDFAMVNANLSEIDLDHNELTQLENYFEIKLPKLRYLSAAHNRLKGELGPKNLASDNLETILLNDNELSSVKEFSFVEMNNLIKVDLRRNQLELLDVNALRLDDAEFGERPRFFIAGNPFRCDCHMSWLRSVNSSVPSFFPLVADLEHVSCQMLYSRSQDLVSVSSAHLHSFLCSYESHCFALCHCCDYDACDCEMSCPASCTCFHDTSWTKNVADCSKADIDAVPDDLPMDATDVFLDGNMLKSLDGHAFIGRKNLQVLYLNHSSIGELHEHTFNGLIALTLLHLNGNSLRKLPEKVFKGLTSLRELYLNDNLLSHLDNSLIEDLENLQLLDLRDNKLIALPKFNRETRLPVMRLSDNLYVCQCELMAFVLGNVDNGVVEDAEAMVCSLNNAWVDLHVARANLKCAKANLTESKKSEKPADQTLLAHHPHASLTKLVSDLLPAFLAITLLLVLATTTIALIFVYRTRLKQWVYKKYRIGFFQRVVEDPSQTSLCTITLDALIVHCAEDENLAMELAGELIENDQNCRFRVGLLYRDLIYPSLDILASIKEGIDGSRKIVLLLSRHLSESELMSRKEMRTCVMEQCRRRRRDLITVIIDNEEGNNTFREFRWLINRRDSVMLPWSDPLFWPRLNSFLAANKAIVEDQRQWLLKRSHEDDSDSFRYENCEDLHNNHYTIIRTFTQQRQRAQQQHQRAMTIHM